MKKIEAKRKLFLRGIRFPRDFDGFPCPDDPLPENWRETAWVWVTDGKTRFARVKGHAFAKEIVAVLNGRK